MAGSSQDGETTSAPGLRNEPDLLAPSLPRDLAARTQRERILRAMAKSCDEKTFAGTTIADIVGNASISRATFYKHFANKRECFDAAADHFLAELREVADGAGAEDDASQPAAVREAIAAVLSHLAAQPEQARLLLVEAPSVDPWIVRRYRGLVTGALQARLQAAGEDDRGGADPEIAFGRATVLIAEYLAADEVERLPALLPELVYVALLPYLGHGAALEQARSER